MIAQRARLADRPESVVGLLADVARPLAWMLLWLLIAAVWLP